MNKIFLSIILIFSSSHLVFSQATYISKQLYGIQVGLFGMWSHTEMKLYNNVALRLELGLDNAMWISSNNNLGFVFVPSIVAEQRWYYNLSKRVLIDKEIKDNSGNYFSLFSRLHPNWFALSNQDIGEIIPDISIIPTWGIRRKIGNKFVFETAFGIGYKLYLQKNSYGYYDGEIDYNFTLRVGYNF